MILSASCSLALSACASGRVQDRSSSAPTSITSAELVSAEIAFDDSSRLTEDPREYAMHPPGFYHLSLKRNDHGAAYSAVCTLGSLDGEKIIDLQFEADASSLSDLEQLIRGKSVAGINGVSLAGTAVKGTTSFDAVYASGEEIHASAEGGAELPAGHFKTDWFVDWFRSEAERSGHEFCNPLIMYADPQVSRILPDSDLIAFSLSCRHAAGEQPDQSWPAGSYSMRIEKENGEISCSLGYQSSADDAMRFSRFILQQEAMADLKAMLKERDAAMLNGYQRIEDTSVTQLWLQADFASGESVFANAQGLASDVKPYVYYEDSWYLDFFRSLAAQYGSGFPS